MVFRKASGQFLFDKTACFRLRPPEVNQPELGLALKHFGCERWRQIVSPPGSDPFFDGEMQC